MHVQFDHHSKISEVNLGKTLLFLMYVKIRAALGLASLPGLRILQHVLTILCRQILIERVWLAEIGTFSDVRRNQSLPKKVSSGATISVPSLF